jgi:hypothetical protein
MEKFIELIDTYLLNYWSYEKGKVVFECDYGELIFNKEDNDILSVFGIYIRPEYRQQRLCENILHYLIDKSENEFNYICVQDVLSKILYEYLLRFNYKGKNFNNTRKGFIYKIK